MIYWLLPCCFFLALIILWMICIIPQQLTRIQSVQQHQLLRTEKQKLENQLNSTQHKTVYLKDIDQHFADLMSKYHFSWQSMNWLSYLQNLTNLTNNKHDRKQKQHGKEQDVASQNVRLQKIRLRAQKTIRLHHKQLDVQLIDIELEADYTALIHWLLALHQQPALLTLERFSLTALKHSANSLQASITLAIYGSASHPQQKDSKHATPYTRQL